MFWIWAVLISCVAQITHHLAFLLRRIMELHLLKRLENMSLQHTAMPAFYMILAQTSRL